MPDYANHARMKAEMNVFELLILVLVCAAFGFIGHLVSPHYGWIVGAVLPVLILFSGSLRKTIKESPQRRKKRSEYPTMLSQRMVAVLSALCYRPDAELEVNILPFGSVYWKDEMPEIRDMLDTQDSATVLRMFGIRLQLWDNETPSPEDRQLWDAVKRQIPEWALFKRLTLSDEQRAAREKAEQQVQQEFESLDDDEA